MRIISAFLAFLLALAIIFSNVALANEPQMSSETKTNLNIFSGNNVFLAYARNNDKFEGFMKKENQIDPEREKTLEKYAEKRKTANYPKGKFIINASAYTASIDECGKSDGITASGLKVLENETIACSRKFPFGTKINISGMGIYICEDRGGAIRGSHIDIYMKTKSEAFAFGRQNLEAEVVM